MAAALLLAGVRLAPAASAPSPAPPPVSPGLAGAPTPDERTSLLRPLVVGEGETVTEATCLGCDVVVRGRVLGDTVALLGDVEVTGSAGRGGGDDVAAIGGGVRVGPRARVPASVLSLGGHVRVDPGASVSAEVDSFPWFPVPGQRRPSLTGVASLVVLVLAGVLAGGALVREKGIVTRDAALARSPVARGLIGVVLLAAPVAAMTMADWLHSRLETVAQSALGLGLVLALVLGSTGVASLLGRGVARLARRRLEPGGRSAAVGSVALALACLVPLVGAAIALAALILACGAAVARRGTLAAPPDEVPR